MARVEDLLISHHLMDAKSIRLLFFLSSFGAYVLFPLYSCMCIRAQRSLSLKIVPNKHL